MTLTTESTWTRRSAVAALGSLPAAMLVPSLPTWALKPGGPPVARVEAVSETLWGETIVDPYRWMESSKDRDWEPFMKGWAAYTRSVLDAIPGRRALAERIGKLSGDLPVANAPQSASGRLFYEMRPAGASQFNLYMRDAGPAGTERLLIDPGTMKGEGGAHMSLDWWVPSPDGRYVVHGLSAAGSEDSVARILDVNSGQLLPERIDRTQYASPSWLPDSSGFFYLRLAAGSKPGSPERYLDTVSWLHRLRTEPETDIQILARGLFAQVPVERNEFPGVAADASSAHVLAGVFGGVRRENPLYTARLADVLAGAPQWKRVCGVEDEVTGFAFRADELFLLSTLDAPNGRVLRTSLSAPDLAKAAVSVPEGAAALEAIAVAKDGLYLRDMDGGYSSLRRLGNDGSVVPIALPFEGSIEAFTASTDEDGLWFAGTSWLLPQSVFRVNAKQVVQRVPLAPAAVIDTSGFEAIRSVVIARDGTQVPLSIIARKGLKRNGRNPTLVNAYGSYQISYNPYFNARGIAFVEQGGVLAFAHVRGGGEYGKRWWRSGQKLSKPNTWRDLIDACEALVKQGWTSARHLAIQGGSAGGITVGRALTERPELFAAVISNVGVSNALRAEFSPNGPPNIDEFGTVTERGGFLGLKQMDALQAVRDGVRYPAVLLTTGMTDPRVEPWQVAKMAARLQAVGATRRANDRNPVLLRVEFDAGHGLGSTREQSDAERADEYSFVLWRTGHPGFQPKV